MLGTINTRQLGTITRIYKNSDNRILAVDEISIQLEKEQVNLAKFIVFVQNVSVKRFLHHDSNVSNRVAACIQMIGTYTEVEENSGNYYVVRWIPDSASENTVEISLAKYVSSLGDTI